MEDAVEKIDIYYNPHTTELEGVPKMASLHDIRVQKRDSVWKFYGLH